MAEPLQRGDIVRFMSSYLGIIGHAWDSTMAPVSGRLVSIDYLGYKCHCAFGWHVGVVDAATVEFMAKGVLPGAIVEELGMEHPWIMARMQARIDAAAAYRYSTSSFREVLAMAECRADDLFGGAPQGWVATAVAQVYAGRGHDRQRPIERCAS
ncbi:MAG: hypothetical protein KKF85_06100 [Gammaproteobacteria bacterium]|nr:hypothetical protein [Rhodocyclaceae bacterium]MBU3907584.1 hypothetical protein [Gammaproteobacteria bacterium]MBU4004230.1 hypothetical protein [Gammaproteobacteria bacterium]MBU4019639.1 hypothetical protein [Gammaproteobacteria bacterium]MBU4095038.1 hypothetical protein [Gammaproteobacteria bacterium]